MKKLWLLRITGTTMILLIIIGIVSLIVMIN